MRPGDLLGGRYELLQELGSGSMGVVYRARDHARGGEIAVKTLRALDPHLVYRLKHEFRSLADLAHGNLVRLHDLIAVDGSWLLTMELVEGVPFPRFVSRVSDVLAHTDDHAGGRLPLCRADTGRLRAALGQLALGVAAVHAAGKLHRDVKPANVLVTPAGRVVLLDFGLARDVRIDTLRHENLTGLVGTPAYMAPEQIRGEPLTPSADWYAVGALLFEAFTGRPPFEGSWANILLAKQRDCVMRPSEVARGVPDDLDALCARLMAPDPRSRPSGSEVLGSILSTGHRPNPRSSPLVPQVAFVGRERELHLLRTLWAGRRGARRPAALLLQGASGIGKTALVRRFLEGTLSTCPEVLVLTGRCYERESLPYKSVDPVVDELAHYLRSLPRADVAPLVPAEVGPLLRAFPVLGSIQEIAARDRRDETVDPQELRSRAAVALRELVARVAARRPVIVWVDDLQWGDPDSAALWLDVLGTAGAPPLLWIGCHRSGAEESSLGLRVLTRGIAAAPGLEHHTLDLEPLTAEDAKTLAQAVLEPSNGTEHTSELVRSSDGNPFFVLALARFVRDRAPLPPVGFSESQGPRGVITLDAALAHCIEELSAAARRLLEAVAVAGRPITHTVTLRAVSRDFHADGDLETALAELRNQHWIRTVGSEGGAIDTYHDRIRDAMLRRLPKGTLVESHGRLADAWIAEGGADPEDVAHHLHGAGRIHEAMTYFALAARRASDALAFDRAATLFHLALEIGAGDQTLALTLDLADALAHAGRGAEAAEVYLTASRRVEEGDPLRLRWRAAEEWIRSGHVDRGLAVAAEALAAHGLPLPRGPLRAAFGLLVERAATALRIPRKPGEAPPTATPDALARIDVCFSFAAGLGIIDPIVGAYYQAKLSRLASHAGDPLRLSRALALEGGFRAAWGEVARERVTALLDRAERLALASGDRHALGWVRLLTGIAAHQRGEWLASRSLATEAENIFRDCMGGAWERVNARRLLLTNVYWTGDLLELRRSVPQVLAEAERRGDRYESLVVKSLFSVLAHLAADEPEQAARARGDLHAHGSSTRPRLFEVYVIVGATAADLHGGMPVESWERLRRSWPRFERALFLRVAAARTLLLDARARSALAAGPALSRAESRRARRVAEADARRLEGQRVRWPVPLALLIRAGLASGAGERAEARNLCARALALFESQSMVAHAAAARWRLGELIGGPEGVSMVRAATEGLHALGVQNAERWVAMLAPGFGT